MATLLACPFCRTMYRRGEGASCAVCGVPLVPFASLPPSADALAEEPPLAPLLPEDEPLPWSYWARGRGLLLALSVLGFGLFFAPWVRIELPETAVRSGFELARGRAGWLWGGATGWLVLIPLVWTRRTIYKLRGIRPIAVAFAAMTLGEVALMVAMPPQGRYVPVEIHWAFGLYASALVSAAATVTALLLGGSLPPLPAAPAPAAGSDEHRILH
ncbi:MAG TPA: hypothetical protein VFV94_14745 [Polyangiaceae bacterium]|nr:hypothetical protein [Polyangiaceae bacterium]